MIVVIIGYKTAGGGSKKFFYGFKLFDSNRGFIRLKTVNMFCINNVILDDNRAKQ